MEAKIADKLREYSSARTKFFDSIPWLSMPFIESVPGIHWTLLLSTITVLIVVYAQIRQLTLFSMHPLCMTIGVLIFIASGLIEFKNHFLIDTFGPLMQHTRKTKIRNIHKTLQLTGTIFISFGLVFIAAHKFEFDTTFIPYTPHAILGLLCITLIIIQIIIGMQKIEYLEWANTKIRKWHNDAAMFSIVYVWIFIHAHIRNKITVKVTVKTVKDMDKNASPNKISDASSTSSVESNHIKNDDFEEEDDDGRTIRGTCEAIGCDECKDFVCGVCAEGVSWVIMEPDVCVNFVFEVLRQREAQMSGSVGKSALDWTLFLFEGRLFNVEVNFMDGWYAVVPIFSADCGKLAEILSYTLHWYAGFEFLGGLLGERFVRFRCEGRISHVSPYTCFNIMNEMRTSAIRSAISSATFSPENRIWDVMMGSVGVCCSNYGLRLMAFIVGIGILLLGRLRSGFIFAY
eukprot:gene8897-18415_t